MTLVSTIITDAYRETNIIPLVSTPNTNQVTEGLRRLNALVASVMGFEAGDDLYDLNYGGDYDQSTSLDQYLPDNVRLVLNLSAATTLNLDPYPYEGQRLGVVDTAGNLATYNLILDGNGRTIEGAASVTLNTNSAHQHWMYRADIGDWVKLEDLESTDQMPFPQEFDDFFITALALRINPRYGQSLTPETQVAMARSRSHLRSRYYNKRARPSVDLGLWYPQSRQRWWAFDGDFDRGFGWQL